jgi:hypothetical protein
VRNQEKGSNNDEKGQNRWKTEKGNNFRILFQKTMEKVQNSWEVIKKVANNHVKGEKSLRFKKKLISEKNSKKVVKQENGSNNDEKGLKRWEIKKGKKFWIFSRKNGKGRKRWEITKKGQIMMKNAKVDEKSRNQKQIDFFQANIKKFKKGWKRIK